MITNGFMTVKEYDDMVISHDAELQDDIKIPPISSQKSITRDINIRQLSII